jgi:alkanesulfonate monooxygenase SsuD/methylene tetrahydromethanopterin reductase-like flavin-dependent oxidoreductase (luciferase family)
MRLSLLDLQWPGDLPVLLPAVEQLGYFRYWATEHYSGTQSASPVVVAALAAGLTDRIRIGTAGILLRSASALRVACDFAALELFFPGRIDLGIAGATPNAPYLDHYEPDVRIATGEAYEGRAIRLVGLVRDGRLPRTQSPVGPLVTTRPELWMCGTSAGSARLAGRLGMSFVYHHYLAELAGGAIRSVGREYRDAFVPRPDGRTPYFAIACYGACGMSASHAEAEWRSHFSGSGPAPSFMGTGKDVVAAIGALIEQYAADEVLLDCFASSLESRIDGLAMIASAANEQGGPGEGAGED